MPGGSIGTDRTCRQRRGLNRKAGGSRQTVGDTGARNGGVWRDQADRDGGDAWVTWTIRGGYRNRERVRVGWWKTSRGRSDGTDRRRHAHNGGRREQLRGTGSRAVGDTRSTLSDGVC